MLIPLDKLDGLLVCPETHTPLRDEGEKMVGEYGRTYPKVAGQPILVNFDKTILDRKAFECAQGGAALTRRDGALSRWFKRHILHGGADQRAEACCKRFLEETKRLADRPLILIVGGGTRGIGTDFLYQDSSVELVSFDIYVSPNTQFVADAHQIPLRDRTVHGVWIQYVLEHVLSPNTVVAEIARLLVPHGIVFSETPFLQQVHEKNYDFTRFTHSGHRWLFRDFEELESGVAMGQGPQILWTIDYFAQGIFRSRFAGKVAKCLFFWAQYLDLFLSNTVRFNSASSFYFLGRKADAPLCPTAMVGYYDRREESQVVDGPRVLPGSQPPHMRANIAVSPSELIDRITILSLKLEHVKDGQQKAGLIHELEALRRIERTIFAGCDEEMARLIERLAEINRRLWDVEDAVRLHERDRDFGEEFIALARSIYSNNDRRAALRREINERLGWKPYDDKIHPDYGQPT